MRVRLITHPGSPTNRHASVPSSCRMCAAFGKSVRARPRIAQTRELARCARHRQGGTDAAPWAAVSQARTRTARRASRSTSSRARLALAARELPRPGARPRAGWPRSRPPTPRRLPRAGRTARAPRRSPPALARSGRRARPRRAAAAPRPTPSGRERATSATVRATRLPSWFASSFGSPCEQLLAEVDVAGARDVADAPPAQRVDAVTGRELERIETRVARLREPAPVGCHVVVDEDGRRQPHSGREQDRGPVDGVEADDPLADHVHALVGFVPPGVDSGRRRRRTRATSGSCRARRTRRRRPGSDRRAPGSPSRERARAAARR